MISMSLILIFSPFIPGNMVRTSPHVLIRFGGPSELIKAIHLWTLCAYNLIFKTVVCVLRPYLYLKCFTYLEDH